MKQEHATRLLKRKLYPGTWCLKSLNCSRKSHMIIRLCIRVLILCVFVPVVGAAQRISASGPQTGTIVGTVVDVNDDPVPDAQVSLEGSLAPDHPHVVTSQTGFFQFDHLTAGAGHITVSASGFANWVSPEVTLKAGQYQELTGIRLNLAEVVTTVQAAIPTEQIATQQIKVALHQRALGFIPDFYAVYDSHPVPLTPKLKFELSLRTVTDPVTFLATGFLAGTDQAAGKTHYQQGAEGYFERFGARYGNAFTNNIVGGALLPSILHQDPRYYYQGTGTTKSRILHAVTYPFVCWGDNGQRQPNYSSLGGYLASGAIANAYYPESNRGPKLLVSTALVEMGGTMVNGLLAEFLMHKKQRYQAGGN
jgi:Carboxypeptidase regulatory-like domain